jgi:MoxR-like ATPase
MGKARSLSREEIVADEQRFKVEVLKVVTSDVGGNCSALRDALKAVVEERGGGGWWSEMLLALEKGDNEELASAYFNAEASLGRYFASLRDGKYTPNVYRARGLVYVVSGNSLLPESDRNVASEKTGVAIATALLLGYEPLFPLDPPSRDQLMVSLGLKELVPEGELSGAWGSARGLIDGSGQRGGRGEGWGARLSPMQCACHAQLRQFSNLVLEGVPGTGKTFAYRDWIRAFEAGEQLRTRNTGFRAVDYGQFTFHAATTYEDFIEGLRPGERESAKREEVRRSVLGRENVFGNFVASPEQPPAWFHDEPASHSGSPNGQAPRSRDAWTVHDGFFLRACAAAQATPDAAHFVLLDELNRANVPAVLGDLLTLLEPSKRAKWNKDPGRWEVEHAVTLPASRRLFFVPENLYVIATMNTVDRSVAALDQALRRRFAFVRVEPMSAQDLKEALATLAAELTAFESAVLAWDTLNGALRSALGANAVLGHSYFFDAVAAVQAGVGGNDALRNMLRYALIPQLIETLRVFGAAAEWLGSQGGDGKSRKPRAEVDELLKSAGEPALRVTYSEGIIDSYTIDLVASMSTGQ